MSDWNHTRVDDTKSTAALRRGIWRYQAVYIEDSNGDRGFTLCEVYFDEIGQLEAWTEAHDVAPGGITIEDLSKDIARMLADVYKWQPVAFDDLRVGMIFKRTGADVKRMITTLEAIRRGH